MPSISVEAGRPASEAVTQPPGRSLQSRMRFWGVTLSAALLGVLPIWALHRDSPRTLVSFHGFIHAAIAERFLDPTSSAFPPENPFFAGRAVCYYWFFQFLAAQVTRACGWSVFHAMEALSMLAMITLIVAAASLGRRLFASTGVGLFIAFLVVAGTNPFGALFAATKVVLQGTERLHDDPQYLWGVVHPVYSLIRYNDVGGLYGPLLNFFLNVTSRPLALAALLVLVGALEWALRSRRALAWLLVAAATALTAALSSIQGIAAAGALWAGILAACLWRDHRAGVGSRAPRDRDLREPVVAGLAFATGLLAAAPTYYHLLLGPSDSVARVWLLSWSGMQHLATLLPSIGPLVLLALMGFRRASPSGRAFLGVLLSAALLLLAADATFELPDSNQSNFFHAAALLLSVPAAASILRRDGNAGSPASPRRALAIAAVFLPTTVLLLSAYVHRPPLPLAFDGAQLQRLPRHSPLANLYEWVHRQTPSNAVFIVDPRPPWVAMCGNISEFPAMTGRFLFTEQRQHYMVHPYPDSTVRVDMAERLVAGEPPRDGDEAYVRALARPVFLLTYRADDAALLARLRERYGAPRFLDGSVAVFAWPPLSSGTA